MFRKALCAFMALLLAVSLCACKKEYQSFEIHRKGPNWGRDLERSIEDGEQLTVLTEGSRLWKKFVKCAPSLPLETDEDITEYAWEIQEILADRLYIRETEVPVTASIGDDGVMNIFYCEAGLWSPNMLDGPIVYVYVALETGAVLAITPRWPG